MLTHVWYAAYGSNISPERFDCYLHGGRPPGATRTQVGCRDSTPPTQRVATRLPGRMMFGNWSEVWGGGVAFYDPDATGPAFVTAYRVTVEQFADVWAQERDVPLGVELPVEQLLTNGEWTAGPGDYERALVVGEFAGEPILTFSFPHGSRPEPNAPAAAYASTIGRGLVATHGMSEAAAQDYLAELIADASTPSSSSR